MHEDQPQRRSTILHIDMDAFYASVEERDQPALRGQPLVVGGSPEGRGVVAAANYVARRYGIHSAMPMATARRLCATLVILPGRHAHYAQVSRQIRDIFLRYTPLVEPLSLDEAFLDVAASEKLFGPAVDIGRRIQREIADELRLSASVGVAPSKFVAKVASDIEKPAGFVLVEPQAVQAFLDPLPATRLWGVGKVGQRELARMGLTTIADVRRTPAQQLQRQFGQWGEHIWRLANGIDEREVVPEREAKSISHETTFETDIRDMQVLRMWLLELTHQVAARLRSHALRAETVQLKLRYPDFKTITRAHSLSQPSDVTQELWQVAQDLLARNLARNHKGVRLLGMGVSGLHAGPPMQQRLFEEELRVKHGRMDGVADDIRRRFGDGVLWHGLEVKRRG
jgi:DNA polymerase IV